MRCRSLHRHDANSLVPHYDLIAFAHVEKLHRAGAALFSIESDGAIHHGGLDLDLFAIESDERLLVCRHVEIAGENSIRRGLGQLRIGMLSRFGPMLAQSQN